MKNPNQLESRKVPEVPIVTRFGGPSYVLLCAHCATLTAVQDDVRLILGFQNSADYDARYSGVRRTWPFAMT